MKNQKLKNSLSHIDDNNQPQMVDVSNKGISLRRAVAQSCLKLPSSIAKLFTNGEFQSPKGPVIQTAIIAGTMGVKKTSDLIPFCHPLPLQGIKFESDFNNQTLVFRCEVKVEGKTGVEMEALTGASTAALAAYDMLKALSHDILISEIKLLFKEGGKSDYRKGNQD